jgi:hypothetical protein
MTGAGTDRLFWGASVGPLCLVESYWPGVSAAAVAAADIDTDSALRSLGDRLSAVRHLGSMLVPEDELLLRLFAGGPPALINEANRRAGIPVERVVEVVALAPARIAGRGGRPVA